MEDGDSASGTSPRPPRGVSVGSACWIRRGRPLTCRPSYCVSGWTSPSPLAGARGESWGPRKGGAAWLGPGATPEPPPRLMMPDQTQQPSSLPVQAAGRADPPASLASTRSPSQFFLEHTTLESGKPG